MMQIIINNKNLFLNLLLILFSYRTCQSYDCSTCTPSGNLCSCNSQCFSKTTSLSITCVNCDINDYEFYSIDSNDVCSVKPNCNEYQKIVYESKECVNYCNNDNYALGDLCYSSQPVYTICDSSKLCECQFKYYSTSFGGKSQYFCLSDGQDCPNGYQYYYNNQCSQTDNICTGMKKKLEVKQSGERIFRCSRLCGSNEKLVEEIYCVDDCAYNGKIIYYPEDGVKYNLQCVDDCLSIPNFYELNGECISSSACLSKNFYLDETNKKCVSSCDSSFVGTDKKCIESSSASDCYYKEEDEASQTKTCYGSCAEIGTNYIYVTNKKCSTNECDYHTDDNGVEICYNSREECFTHNYKYFKGKTCSQNCYDYINGEQESQGGISIDCFTDINDCINKGFYFYTSSPKKCYHSCPSPLNPNFLENDKPKEDNSLSTCSSCDSNFSKLSKGYCKLKCDEDECYYLSSPKICKSINENFYYVQSSEKICVNVNDCDRESEYKYNFEGSKECLNICKSRINSDTFIYYDSNNRCLEECNGYAEIPSDNHKECKDEILTGFFYEDNNGKKIIISSCNKLISSSNSKKCVSACENSNEKVENIGTLYKCVSSCSNKYGKYKLEITNENDEHETLIFNKCMNECSESQPNFNLNYFIPETKQCVESCDANSYYIIDNNCYKKCIGSNKNIQSDTYICSNSCSLLKRKISNDNPDIYFCTEECTNEEYLYKNECLLKCPSDYNKIGANKKCKPECEEIDGIYKKLKETINGDNEYNIYECINGCSTENGIYVVESEKECFTACPVGYKKIKYGDFKCLPQCPTENPYYINSLNTNGHIICYSMENCIANNYHYVDQDNNCVNNACSGYNFKEKIADGFYRCKQECKQYIILKDSINGDGVIDECVEICPRTANYIFNEKYCKTNSEIGDSFYYKFRQMDEYTLYKCTSSCENNFYLRSSDDSDKQCYDKCPLDSYLSPNENKCYNHCKDSSLYPFTLTIFENDVEKKICSHTCNDDFPNYEDEDKICKLGCNLDGKKVINEDGKCVESCGSPNSRYNFNLDGKCVETCSGEKPRFDNNYVCREKCDQPGLNFVVSNECKNSCDPNQYKMPVKINGVQTGEYECEINCNGKYFYPTDNICIDECNGEDYALEDTLECVPDCSSKEYETGKKYHSYIGDSYPVNTCVKECPIDKPYLDGNNCENSCLYSLDNICQEECPEYTYYVSNFDSDDEDQQKKCLSDCPIRYPYYLEQSNRYLCMSSCPNTDSKFFKDRTNLEKIGLKCIPNCNNDYKYLTDDEKECLSACPPQKYYVSLPNNKCLGQCPEDFPYHKKNEYECTKMEGCNTFIIDYNEKLCVDDCLSSKYKYIETINSNDYTVCLNSCSDYGKYLTPDKKCVSSCEEDSTLNLEIDSSASYKCKCKFYYYTDLSTLEIKCLDSTATCQNADSDGIYKIEKYGSKECLSRCNGILSLNGDYCYNEENQCGDNTKVITVSGQKQCDCLYKFYYDNSRKKICMGSSDECPSERSKYIPATKQCIETCPNGLKLFQNFCLDLCPQGAEFNEDDAECQCTSNEKNWYSISDTNFECLPGECKETHPFLEPTSRQCLKKCKGTKYPLLVVNKCYSDCSEFENTESSPIDDFANDFKYATQTCRCKKPWYFDEIQKQNNCPSSTSEINHCSDFNGYSFNYIVKTTRQCVIACPSDYPYSFNDECFHSCEREAKEIYNYNVKTNDASKVCICENLWKYNSDKIECLDEAECPSGYLEIFDSRECYKIEEGEPEICPTESPLILNKICYKIGQCPTNSHYNPDISGKCVCDNLWYITEDEKIFCLPISTDICPDEYPYQIYKTKKCIKPQETESKCPEGLYVFNYICYEDKCPQNTRQKSDSSNICLCDETKGKWYKYNYYNPNSEKVYLHCGLTECPTDPYKPNLLEEKNQCTYNCDEDGEITNIWAFKKICYEECPEFTKQDPPQKRCIFYQLDEASDLEHLRNYVSVQVKELYESGPEGGVLYNNLDASLQIYSIGRNFNDKELQLKSNLSYIELDTCLNKVFDDQNITDDDRIYVVKYDLLNSKSSQLSGQNTGDGEEIGEGEKTTENNNKNNKNTENYLANQVEYEFYSSKTLKRIEISVCEPKEIIVSYPIAYTLAKFDSNGRNNNEYRNKLQIGKDLHNQNKDIDTFNFNNSVYKELCTPIVINGKDLVLEDRYENLFPNNVTLCEENCTVYYIDYELERVNCKCNYKEILDFNREEPVTIDLLNDPNFNHPSQSGANGEVIKCLSKLPGKDSILKNEAFYYSAVITVAEASMILVAVFHGIKAVSGNITNLMNKPNLQNNIGNKEAKKIEFKNDNVISTSNRVLNNPPKKGNNFLSTDEEEVEKKEKTGNIMTKKNIEINYENNIYNEYENGSNFTENENENNYGVEIKNLRITSGTSGMKKTNNPLRDTKNKNNEFIGKTEFIPIQYNFKFFKSNDKGIIKKIEKSKIPFDVKSTTKYLLEKKENINYDSDYLDGPFLPNQNIIEIINDNKNNKNESIQDILNNNINNRNNNQGIKTKERNIKNTNNNEITSNEKGFITIKKINPHRQRNEINFIVQDYVEPQKEQKTIYDNTGIYTLIKKEQTLLRVPFKKYLEKTHSNIFSTILAEIMDKIYLIKICCFLKKFEIFSVRLALYLICHLLLLTLLCAFFTIKIIKKIWKESNFPQLNFYLLYGFIGNIVIWIIYRIFLCLLDIQDKVKELVRLKNEVNKNNENKISGDNDEINENNEEINEEFIQKKYNDVIKKIKIKTTIFFIIGFLLTVICFIYLVSFFAIYTGTKSKVFELYYISLIEIVLIKIVYGICLGALRIASEGNKIETIYKIVYLCDKYLS